MATHSVLIADPISESGLEVLRQAEGFSVKVQTGMDAETLAAEPARHDGLIVRSGTQVTAEVLARPGRLKVIGRAGTGVDNIDLDAATRSGIVVVNTPGGNSVAAAELALSLLFALARNIPQADRSMREGKWSRKEYMGVEVSGKILGVVGLGRVGRELGRRARGCRMTVLGHDPFVSQEALTDSGISWVPLEELFQRSDFVSLHVPLTEGTADLIGPATLAKMKPGARIINCARGGLVDEAALLEALDAGRIGGAALDVFRQEPPTDRRLVEHPKVISTPHLGASTLEAQQRVGSEIASKVREFLETGTILDAVNFPSISREEHAVLRPVMDLAEKLGAVLGQSARGGMKGMELRCFGEFTRRPLRPLTMAAAKGLLGPVLAGGVSYVNALSLAQERGITVEDGRSNESTPFSGLLKLSLVTDAGRTEVEGTLFRKNDPRLVALDGVEVECSLRGHLLYFQNRDVPGVVGQVGSILGKGGVNIAGIQLGRSPEKDTATCLVSVDTPLPQSVLDEIRAMPEIARALALSV